MSIGKLAWRLLSARALRHLLTAAIVALGLGLMLAATATTDATRSAISLTASRFPLVVGGRGGAVSLVLGALTRLEEIDGGIDAELAQAVARDPRVELAVPLLGGHAVGGYPLLATTPDYLQPRSRYPLDRGRIFALEAHEVVVGSKAAQGLDLELGDELSIDHRHGGSHPEPLPLQVVGILREVGSDMDSTVLCGISSIRASHGGEAAEGVSALLIRPVDNRALLELQEELDGPEVQVALTGQTLRRVSERLAGGGQLLEALVSGVVLITLLSLALAVYGTSLAQTHDVAVMRVLGARRIQVVTVVGAVTLVVVCAGAVAGLAVGGSLCNAAERMLHNDLGLDATVTLLSPTSVTYLAVACGLLLVVGVQPAVAAYNLQAAEALSELPGAGRAATRQMRWGLRFVIPLILLLWGFQVMSQHSAEASYQPIDSESQGIFKTLADAGYDKDGGALAELDGDPVELQGYMFALGDPFTAQEFYLVAIDPRLPQCPFCYRSPTRWERVQVVTGGRDQDIYAGLVQIRGVFHADASADEPLWIQLEHVDIVLP